MGIEERLDDCELFIQKLLTVLTDKQVVSLNHQFYKDYSNIEPEIRNELTRRGLSTKREFTEYGDFKY